MVRSPLVCGVAGGVGATTIAAALQAQDVGIYCGGPVDIVVCRTTSSSVAAAHRVANSLCWWSSRTVPCAYRLRRRPA